MLPDTAVTDGWVKLREDAMRKGETDEANETISKLKGLEDKARSAGKGIWSSTGGHIDTSHELSEPKAFAELWKGKSIDSVVEKVLAGDRMILRLMPSPTEHVQTLIAVAGIRAPALRRANTADGKEQPAEPFGPEALQFVETRLTQRTVKADVVGVTPQGILVCNVIHPNGSIAEFLLREGLARCIDFHSTMLGGAMAKLRKAEKHARDNSIGIFKGQVKSKSSAGEQEVTVTRVHTADTLYIKDRSGEEKRINLSSIRQPKPSDPKQAPFAADAKEFVRKKLIGKHVKVRVDGRKEANEGYDARDVMTVVLNDKNVALQIVEAGWASVIRHRQDDTDRSPIYDDLLAAEASAQAEQKGLWSSKPPAAKVYQDYSESLQKAKIQASVLQRQKHIPANVDFVKGASRFSLIVPRENAKLTFVLSGIRAPKSARNPSEKSEPFGQEAHELANRRLMQRDVEIDVEGVDKVGGFIGSLYINRENFAKVLLEDGLASVHAYSAEQSGHAREFLEAEGRAKQARKGLWHDYDPSITDGVDNMSLEETTNGTKTDDAAVLKKDYRDVFVTHIDPTNLHLKIQLIGATTSVALNSLTSAFRTYHSSPSANGTNLSGAPKSGEYIAAKFSEDGLWYRGRVRRNDREAQKSEVTFMDYGNSEMIPWKELRTLDPAGPFSASKLKPQAVDAGLSYLQFATSKEYVAEAVDFLREEAEQRQFVASVDFEEKDGGLWVTLFDAERLEAGEEESLNKEAVEEGIAMVGRKLRPWEVRRGQGKVVPALRKAEESAKEKKRGIWEYGDISED